MNIKKLLPELIEKINKHHELYRFPVKAELWEDIFDQVINGSHSNWVGGGHSSGADVISEGNIKIQFQNKSGDINYRTNIIKWNGHRTTKFKTLSDKLDFISEYHCDKYVMLGRNKKEWDKGIKKYNLIMFDSEKIDYKKLNWTEKYSKTGELSGWKGENNNLPYSATINKKMSDQLWTECDMNYLGKIYDFVIGN